MRFNMWVHRQGCTWDGKHPVSTSHGTVRCVPNSARISPLVSAALKSICSFSSSRFGIGLFATALSGLFTCTPALPFHRLSPLDMPLDDETPPTRPLESCRRTRVPLRIAPWLWNHRSKWCWTVEFRVSNPPGFDSTRARMAFKSASLLAVADSDLIEPNASSIQA